MSRKVCFSKEYLLQKSVDYIEQNGIDKFNIRDLSKFVGCSTQPFFKYYNSMEEFKVDLKKYLHLNYESFINKYIDKKHYLYTISYAYALYAKYKSNCFKALFITDLAGERTIEEVLTTDRNIETITALEEEYSITNEKARNVYRDVRFYTHGIATQLCIKSIKIDDDKLSELIKNNIELNIKGEI